MVYKKDLDLQKEWVELLYKLKELTGKRPADLNAVLFLVGVQELGLGARSFSKEEKQDILHIAICKVLSLAGYYELEGHDEDGWPHWKLIKKLPRFDLMEQEKLLKIQILEYFREEIGW
ncbi:hypothetical protein SAMN05421640_0257 [Ekhidna lutea]|uniref:Uncharacterized protein n=1 Tax=Ekhidna lutea TaxID=447679 RepID=A0A239ERA4_EKHLU|nr:hypothetical protein [Ekhidna lutea]SNS46442.1 hypothetical protein SAMN05421640_0257 [Ekhidna lutea]